VIVKNGSVYLCTVGAEVTSEGSFSIGLLLLSQALQGTLSMKLYDPDLVF
jgi:hypothetical protein